MTAGLDETGVETSARAAPSEWWERLLGWRSSWIEGHPSIALRLRRVWCVAALVAVPVLVVVMVVSPATVWAMRAWVGIFWSLFVCFVAARTKTVSWSGYLRWFSVLIVWSGAVGVIDRWVAVDLAGRFGALDTAATVVVAGIVEETLKLAPLAVLALLAPGRVRRLAVVDWLLLGFASGAAFMVVEEGLRRIAAFDAPMGFDFCLPQDLQSKIDCGALNGFGLSPFGGAFDRPSAYAGHAVVTAMVAVCIGLGYRAARSRTLPRPWKVVVAVLLPVTAFWVALVDHFATNASGTGAPWSKLPDGSPPWPWTVTATLTGHGHGRPVVLVILLLAALLADARVYGRHDEADPISDRPFSGLERARDRLLTVGVGWVARSRTSTTTGERQRWAAATVLLDAAATLAYLVARDARDVTSLLVVMPQQVKQRGRSAAASDLILLPHLARIGRVEALRAEFDTPVRGRTGTRVCAVAAALLAVALVVLVAPEVTHHLGNSIDHGVLHHWLAGVLDGVGRWWDDQPVWVKGAIIIGVGALVIASGGTLGVALGVAGGSLFLLDHARGEATFVRNPQAATANYVSTHTAGEMALDGAVMAATFIPFGGAAGLAGRGIKGALGANGVRIIEELGLYRRTLGDAFAVSRPLDRLFGNIGTTANSTLGFPLLGRIPGDPAAVGWATRLAYRRTFELVYPNIDMSQIVIHHAIEKQAILKKWPGMFDRYELHSVENLRGIPKNLNPTLHLRDIRALWDEFYRYYDLHPNMVPTRATVLQYAELIDRRVGSQFNPQELR